MREEFEKLGERFKLPAFEDLKKDFDIESIDKDDNILREILKKIHSRFEYYASVLENLLQPDSTLTSMHEAAILTVKDKSLVRKLYMKTMFLERELLIASLDFTEKNAALVIFKTTKEWDSIKPDLKQILEKLKESWTKEQEIKEQEGYFG